MFPSAENAFHFSRYRCAELNVLGDAGNFFFCPLFQVPLYLEAFKIFTLFPIHRVPLYSIVDQRCYLSIYFKVLRDGP